jgi:hypothetical protein
MAPPASPMDDTPASKGPLSKNFYSKVDVAMNRGKVGVFTI